MSRIGIGNNIGLQTESEKAHGFNRGMKAFSIIFLSKGREGQQPPSEINFRQGLYFLSKKK